MANPQSVTLVAKVEAWAREHPEGFCNDESMVLFGVAQQSLATCTMHMQSTGRLKASPAPRGSGHQRKRYFAPEHWIPAAPPRLKAIPPRGALQGEAIYPAHVVPQVAVTPLPRFHVEHAPSVIESSQCRPWAAAYGGGV